MKTAETCDFNQWSAQVLNEAIMRAALEEYNAQTINGKTIAVDDLMSLIRSRWLDAMVPAGNA